MEEERVSRTGAPKIHRMYTTYAENDSFRFSYVICFFKSYPHKNCKYSLNAYSTFYSFPTHVHYPSV